MTTNNTFLGAPFVTNGSDILVNYKSYPGIQLSGTEAGAGISEVREFAGQTWITCNAFWNGAGWQQYDTAIGSSGIVLIPNGVPLFVTAAAGAPNPISWTYVNQNFTLLTFSFDTVGVGPNNALTAVVARIPLPTAFVPISLAAVCQSLAATTYINVVYGEVTATTPTGAGATATAGNCLFSTLPGLSTAGTPVTALPYGAGAIYPSAGELTLRVLTGGTGGIGGLKVTMYGYV